ncbi:LacI family DNA-binding transcriptional regulator [Aquibacillus rhizosphaerae]|uniref:LacI family DNA-binding transcriptional regulator n=1 Tax=Aquibacillus rhizosphaerae TaxID=3051431 RepID=A0ABT7LBA4_9BACI|nr:LacI family DNA-binding transcriptional regulator [Aquibacillus sp. LR5S19]MDL4843144.1 LacI family DNA-binding transcriptional regulator [Aquibacillus sp. LR5S19]
MATIKEIASMANVSRTTVSRVLNNSGYVSEEVRKRIIKVIEETGYVPSQQAKSLRTKKTKVIGVILPTIKTETSGRLVAGMDDELSEAGYQILLANTNHEKQKEIEFLQLLKVRQVDGIILAATNVNDLLVEKIKQLDIPFVAIGQEISDVSNILYDDYQAAKDITSLFINKGHQQIGFIGVDESDLAVGMWRKKGFFDQMEEKGLSVEEAWVEQGVFNIQSGYEAMSRIIQNSNQTPTAVFAVTDRLAIGAIRWLNEHSYAIPSDMAIAGVGASELSNYITPPLTTVDYENEKAGKEAAKLILRQIEKNNKVIEKITLNYRLLERDSV